MVSPQVNPECCFEFEGEILVLHHPTTISARYQVGIISRPNCLHAKSLKYLTLTNSKPDIMKTIDSIV